MEYFIVCSKQLLFRCDWVPTIYKMDSTTFMVKLFATKVGSLIIVTKSCILGEAAFKMNNYLTCFEAESSNAQFLCNFAFPFFKFCIIPSPSYNLFKCTRIPTWKGASLLWNSSMLLIYPQTVLFLYYLCPKRNSRLLLSSLIHFFDKQFAKNDRKLWIKNILNKLLFLSYSS